MESSTEQQQAEDAADLAAIDEAQRASAAAGESNIPWEQARQELGLSTTVSPDEKRSTDQDSAIEQAFAAGTLPEEDRRTQDEVEPAAAPIAEEGGAHPFTATGEEYPGDNRTVKERVQEFLDTVNEEVKAAFHESVLAASIDALGRGGAISHDETSTTVMGWRNGARIYGHGANTAAALADFKAQAGE